MTDDATPTTLTPAGGVRAEALFYDGEGRPVDGPEGAVAVEILELDESGYVVARTHGVVDPEAHAASPVLGDWDQRPYTPNPMLWDVEHESAKAWDVGTPTAQTRQELLAVFGWDELPTAGQRAALFDFVTLPVFENAPERLRQEVFAWLAATRPETQPETKALRRVRTPEGARHYGAPIGTPIVRDPVTGRMRAARSTPSPSTDDADDDPSRGASRYTESVVENARVTREMLDAEPWWLPAEAWRSGAVPGLRVDPEMRAGLAGRHHHGHGGTTLVSDQIADESPFDRFALLTHEAGHALNAPMATRPDWDELIGGFRREGGGTFDLDNPFGYSSGPSEIIADAYSELLFGRLEEMEDDGLAGASDYTLNKHRFLVAVREEAELLGLPTAEIPNRPRSGQTLADAPDRVTEEPSPPSAAALEADRELERLRRDADEIDLEAMGKYADVEEFGLEYDDDVAASPAVRKARRLTDWADVVEVEVPLHRLVMTEPSIRTGPVKRVVLGGEALREDYVPEGIELDDGRVALTDGHHRAAMHAAMGRDTMPVKVRPAPPPPRELNDEDRAAIRDGAGVVRATAMTHDKAVTADLEVAVAEAEGAELALLDKRVKGIDAIVARAERNVELARGRGQDPDPEAALEGIPDTLRYTVVAPGESYTEASIAVMKALGARGYTAHHGGWGNSWAPGSAYRGLNLRLMPPHEGAPVIEVQFHTPESLKAKRDNHKLYERFRSLPTGDPERKALSDEMRARTDEVDTPVGALGLNWRGKAWTDGPDWDAAGAVIPKAWRAPKPKPDAGAHTVSDLAEWLRGLNP